MHNQRTVGPIAHCLHTKPFCSLHYLLQLQLKSRPIAMKLGILYTLHCLKNVPPLPCASNYIKTGSF